MELGTVTHRLRLADRFDSARPPWGEPPRAPGVVLMFGHFVWSMGSDSGWHEAGRGAAA